MKAFFKKVDLASLGLGVLGLAVVEMLVPSVASLIVKGGNTLKNKVGI